MIAPGRTTALLALGLGVACGTRTGLDAPVGSQGSARDASSDGAPGTVDCRAPPWILFDLSNESAGGVATIYAMRADGSEVHRVPLPESPALYPSVSRDGTKLLYVSNAPDAGDGGGAGLFLYDFATRSSTLVVTAAEIDYSAISPDGQTIAYTAGYSLDAVAPDGTDIRSLLVGSDTTTGYGHPAFTADSRAIVYGALGVIGAIDVDGTNNQTLLTGIVGSFEYPNMAFSPDYTQIVTGIFCNQESPLALLIFPYASLPGEACTSGRVLVDVSASAALNMGANDPSWGPTGLIAYGSNADVYVIPATGGTATNLTAKLTGDAGTITASDPVWAPPCTPVP